MRSAILLLTTLISCGEMVPSEATEGLPQFPDLPKPGPFDCRVGEACVSNSDCGPGLVCGELTTYEGKVTVCGAPCEHSDQCKAGGCSADPDDPLKQGICKESDWNSLGSFDIPGSLCPASPVCAHDACTDECAQLISAPSACIDGECAMTCAEASDCEHIWANGPFECKDGKCYQGSNLLDPCYRGLAHW